MANQRIKANLIPSCDIYPVIHLAQYDMSDGTGKQVEIELYYGADKFTIPSGASVTFRGTKRDKTGYSYAIEKFTDNVVTVDVRPQMTVLSGKHNAELRISKGETISNTIKFVMDIDSSALADDTKVSETDLSVIEKALQASDSVIQVKAEVERLKESVEASEKNAKQSEANASSASASSSQSAQASAESASSASQSATNAQASAESANASATTASTKATEAQTSAESAIQTKAEIEQLKKETIEQASTLTESAKQEISTVKDATVAEVTELKNSTVSEITSLKDSTIEAVTLLKDNAKAEADRATESSASAKAQAEKAEASADSVANVVSDVSQLKEDLTYKQNAKLTPVQFETVFGYYNGSSFVQGQKKWGALLMRVSVKKGDRYLYHGYCDNIYGVTFLDSEHNVVKQIQVPKNKEFEMNVDVTENAAYIDFYLAGTSSRMFVLKYNKADISNDDVGRIFIDASSELSETNDKYFTPTSENLVNGSGMILKSITPENDTVYRLSFTQFQSATVYVDDFCTVTGSGYIDGTEVYHENVTIFVPAGKTLRINDFNSSTHSSKFEKLVPITEQYIDSKNYKITRYGDCIKNPYTFKGKSCDVFGDSIARGWVHWDTSKYPITENNWVKLFCDKVGMTFNNHAVGGSSSSGVLAQITDAGKLTSDYVFVAFGVNDWQDAIALNDFRNNVNAICNALKENFTGIDVIFITPINHSEIIPHKTPIADLQEYRNIITEVVLSNGYSVVQGNTFPFPDKNGEYASLVFGDNIHPTEKIGYPIYANSLLTRIIDFKNPKNVVIYVGSSELSDEQKLSCDYICDGVDDQIEINQAINSLPDSGGEIHLSRGIFNISNSIDIKKRIKLVGEGKGLTLDRSNVNNGGTTLLTELKGGSVILISASDTLSDIKGITLSDFQIVGAGINIIDNYCNGINIDTYTDCVTLERLTICHCYFGLYVNKNGTVDDISITNCDFQRDSCGISIDGKGWQTRIENNIFWDMYGRLNTSGIVLSNGENIVNGNYFGVSSLLTQDTACAWISAKDSVSLTCNGNSFSKCTSNPIRFDAGGQFANISGNSFSEIGKASFQTYERAVLKVDGAGTGGGRISFTNNTVFWANGDDWKTSFLAYLTNQVAQVNISNNTVIDGIGKITEDELVYKSEDSTYAITIGNNALC